MFIYHFLISNAVISITAFILLIIKNISKENLSPACSYFIWFPLLILMFLSFFPSIDNTFFNYNTVPNIPTAVNAASRKPDITAAVKDYFISTNSYFTIKLIWVTGIIFNITNFLITQLRLKKLLSCPLNNNIFKDCCKKTGIKATLYINSKINSPMSFGIIKPSVVLPHLKYDENTLEHIFLHELTHYKHNDIYINYILCVLSAFYWFNPAVLITFKKIKLDMEIYCDYGVLKYTKSNIAYGNTILNLASQKNKFMSANYISGYKAELKTRIQRIANYQKSHSKLLTALITVPLVFIFTLSASVINSYGYTITEKYSTDLKFEEIDLKTYFKGYEGCFVLYNTVSNTYKIYNEDMAKERTSPYSTYKIAIALNGLEQGIITPENNTSYWDKTIYPFDEWNRNQDLSSAMKYSVNWYFQNIDKSLEHSEISAFLNTISYGNKNIGHDKENYWLENTLKISPVEQVEFLKKLYTNEFNFTQSNIDKVINSIKLSSNLYGKTGTGMVNGKTTNGWFIGIYNKNQESCIFALRLKGKNNADGSNAMKIACEILNNM